MSNKRKSAYGGPVEEREVVVTIDRRLLAGLGLVVVFAAAVGLGVVQSRGRGAPPASVPVIAAAPTPDHLATAQAVSAGAVVIQPNPWVTSEPGSSAFPTLEPGEIPLPDVEDRTASQWDPDVLAGFPDPNLSDEYQPARIEAVSTPLEGPRLGISDLNLQHTYNFGDIPNDQVARHTFVAKNVGNQDLTIARIYASCGCTATVIGTTVIQKDGYLPEPLVLKPGESESFVVEFDPRAETSQETNVSQSKYIQIYTNDPTKFVFEDSDPFGREARFRIVMRPRPRSLLESGG